MAATPTVSDLFKAKAVTDVEIDATVDAVLADLAAMGLVEERAARWEGSRPNERAWFLTDLGRRTDRAHGDLPDE